MSSLRNEEFKRTHYAAQLNFRDIGDVVSIAGWIEDIRPLGSITFLTIRDVTGIAQAIVRNSGSAGILSEAVRKVPRQSIVHLIGKLKESRAKEVSVEVEVERFNVLSEAQHPLPVDPTGRVDASLDVHLDAQPLDLRNPSKAAIFKIRHMVLQSIRNFLVDEGFFEVNTPKIIGQAAEGGANLFLLDYFGRPAYLAQSPQLYKEQLTLSLDRVFEVAGYFRAEKSNTRRHLSEFFSVDVEAAFTDEEGVMDICERMVVKTIEEIKSKNSNELLLLGRNLEIPSYPFDRVPYGEAIEELDRQGLPLKMGDDLTDSALRKLGRKHRGFYFIIDWPIHLKPFYIKNRNNFSRSFDLQHGYLELASGGMRVSENKELKKRIVEAGLREESFSVHLKRFEWGMPPHSGWGLGLDRLMMVLTGKKNIREVVLYPRDQYRLLP